MLNLSRTDAEVFVPDGLALDEALPRTTHLGVAAHPDDLEFMAAHGILECFARNDRWFTGVVLSDGAGSPRDHEYRALSDEEMKRVRRREQIKAAIVGEYAAQFLLGHPSSVLKSKADETPVLDLASILRVTRPEVVYTHNLADKHETHVAVALRLIEACRRLKPEELPERVIGCEVWRDLDWLMDPDKVVMPVDKHENLQMALMGVFDSQIAGGKRYDLATLGRRRAHATYFESHGVDRHSALIWGMDLTPLCQGQADPIEYVSVLTQRFQDDVVSRLRRLG